ncbi:MAG: VWA domain-containing protein, partial [Pseudomonadota bacterium]
PGEPLLDRLALSIDLDELSIAATDSFPFSETDIEKARKSYKTVCIDDPYLESLCGACEALGIWSPRISVLACRCARVLAALAGEGNVGPDQLEQVLRLVLLPRATQLPAQDRDDEESNDEQAPEEHSPEDAGETEPPDESIEERKEQTLSEDRIVEAAKAMLPVDLLSRLAAAQISARKNSSSGKSGVIHKSKLRGRPSGTVPGDPRDGSRLDLLATLRAAVPWQKLRAKPQGKALIQVSTQDFRVKRFKERSPSVTVFAVDASGSSALYRLAEVKGAIELLLADCYIRRDEVALIAFKGQGAELLLPPTRSLVRAKRCLAAMPGGGGTPLASAIELGAMTLQQLERKGCTPVFVLLTDGRANVSRDGSTGRTAAMEDTKMAAANLRTLSSARGIVIDTSPRPHRTAADVAEWLAVDYLPLPNADSKNLQAAVSATVRA